MWHIHKREYYSAVKRKVTLMHGTMWMNLENIMLSGRSQTQKATSIWNTPNMPSKDRKQTGGCQELRGGEIGSNCLMAVAFFLGWWQCSGTRLKQWLHSIVNAPKATKGFTLKWVILYMWILLQFKKIPHPTTRGRFCRLKDTVLLLRLEPLVMSEQCPLVYRSVP